MGTETVCTPVHLEASGWMQAAVSGNLVLPGPWRGLLRSKRAGRYQPVRFTVHGELTVHATPTPPPPLCPDYWVDIVVKYLGRGGEEVEVARKPWTDGLKSGEKYAFEKSIDVSKWRGMGLQGVSLTAQLVPGTTPIPFWCWYTTTMDGRICFTLSWVD